MEGRLTFLGTGTSMGVPTLGCRCAVCTSADPRDKRLRPSVMLRWSDEQPRACGGDRHRSGLSRAGAAGATHPRRRSLLYAFARRPHLRHGRSAAAELCGVSQRRTDSAVCVGGDYGGAGAHVRLHVCAGRHLCDAREGRDCAARRTHAGARRGVCARAGAARGDGRCRDSALATRRI